jgi:hypothetical protein
MLLQPPAITPKINIVPLILRLTVAHAGWSPRSAPIKSARDLTPIPPTTAPSTVINPFTQMKEMMTVPLLTQMTLMTQMTLNHKMMAMTH